MTFDQWLAMAKWMTPRLRGVAKWESVTINAYFEDLQEYRSDDVFDTIKQLYAEGNDFEITAGQVIHRLKELGISPAMKEDSSGTCDHVWADLRNTVDAGSWLCIRCHVMRPAPDKEGAQ